MIYLFIVLLLLFEADRLVFVWMNHPEEALSDGWFTSTWWHGLPLDIATACYILALVWLIIGINVWVKVGHAKTIGKVYAGLLAAVLSLIWVADACLYGFWGIRLDGTVWNYLDSPSGVLQSVSILYLTTVGILIIVLAWATYSILWRMMPTLARRLPLKRQRITATIIWGMTGGLIFLGIRGGVGKSTANVGRAYFSDVQFLNHTAVNPVFSIFSSMQRSRRYSEEFNSYPEDERARIFSSLGYSTESIGTDTLLTTSRPNVLVILMEGCGGTFVHAVDSLSDPNITPNLNRLAEEGVVFTQCYANSFRTDRGTVCTFSGYPSFPDVSVMKCASKCTHLPSIASSLKNAGYTTEFLYGGDINFTNTNGYLLGTGYERTTGDTGFPIAVRHTHDWGVTDRITFDSLYQRIIHHDTSRPWHIGFLTLASHEPWGVPYQRIPRDKVANTMAYLDDCIGRFIDRLRRTPLWSNTLIVMLPDHGIGYPEGISADDERRSHIPVIWTGGAVKQARKVKQICNQTDLAATLLGQLALPHHQFRFSRDVLSRTYTHPSAVHVWSEGIFYKDNSGISVLNVRSMPPAVMRSAPCASPRREAAAKAYLQTIYDDLDAL